VRFFHRFQSALFSLVVVSLSYPAIAAPRDDLTATFNRFVAAQNAHDLKAVSDLLWDSPDFLWITRGTPIFGRDAALKRFETLYAGTWSLSPLATELRVTMMTPTTAQLFVPIDFTVGPAGGTPTTMRFLMNQTLVKTARGWVISSILPIPASPPTVPTADTK
jgi:uncharacterized protein (TIGR02246 family)